MERIVLGYDGSPAAVSALSWTAARAARGVAKVDVVFVVSPSTGERGPGLERLGEAEAFLLDRLPGLVVELHRLGGAVTESIARAADDADLVVIGINTGHPIRAAAAGWTPLRLSTRSTAPVYMIPAGWVQGGDPVTVGIADDGNSDAALSAGMAEAAATSTSLRLVHAWLMPSPAFDDPAAFTVDPETVMEIHRQTLDAADQRVRGEHPALVVESQLIRDSRSAALLRFASKSSLLVIGTHRRGVLIASLLGSVAQDILWRADCPICVVPPQWVKRPEPALIGASPVASDPGQ